MNKINIVLIDANPPWLNARRNGAIKEQVAIPLGLMYISSYLKAKFPGAVNIKLINTIIDESDLSAIIADLKAFGAQVVGIRALSTGKDYFYKLADKIKSEIKGIKVFAGGPFISSEPCRVLSESMVDGIITGEGEEAFAEIIGALLKSQPLEPIKNYGYRQKNGEIVINGQRDFIKDIDKLPLPDYSIIDVEKYSRVINYGYTIRKQGMLLTSRGCPFGCKYCFNFLGRSFRPRSPENVFKEIKYLNETYGIEDFFIVDDTFNIQRQRAADLLGLIISWGVKIRLYFTSGLRGDILDRDLIDLMVKAGTIWVSFGVESVNKRIQKLIGRTADIKKLEDAIKYCCDKEIMVGIFFMVCFPTETVEEAMETINFVKSLKRVTMPYFFGVRYFPKTELFDIAVKENIITDKLMASVYTPYHDTTGLETPTMSNLEFKKLFMHYLKETFLDKERLYHALSIQEKYLSKEELGHVYSSILHRKIASPREDLKVFLTN